MRKILFGIAAAALLVGAGSYGHHRWRVHRSHEIVLQIDQILSQETYSPSVAIDSASVILAARSTSMEISDIVLAELEIAHLMTSYSGSVGLMAHSAELLKLADRVESLGASPDSVLSLRLEGYSRWLAIGGLTRPLDGHRDENLTAKIILAKMEDCVRSDPDNLKCHQVGALALSEMRRWPELELWVNHPLNRWPRDPWLRSDMGLVLLAGGDPATAIGWFDSLPDCRDSSSGVARIPCIHATHYRSTARLSSGRIKLAEKIRRHRDISSWRHFLDTASQIVRDSLCNSDIELARRLSDASMTYQWMGFYESAAKYDTLAHRADFWNQECPQLKIGHGRCNSKLAQNTQNSR